MKGRESGMPDERNWATFFDVEVALPKLLGAENLSGDLVEFGCGYGTFTLPTARRTSGIITALDIEPEMVTIVRHKASELSLTNIYAEVRDFVATGTGLPANSQAHAMIYNLLHIEHRDRLLEEARRVLRDDGHLSVMNWRSDVPTPRGPSLDIRPTPELCRAWLEMAGFVTIEAIDLGDCCPYHFGFRVRASDF